MSYKKWLMTTLSLILLPLILVAGFNYYIDPLWNFNHANRYNRIQASFDERQQKTNRVNFGRFDYDTLILGSSRVTYISQYDFTGHRAFNYAVSNMLLDEYYDYVEYAKLKNGRDFDYIILGLDFYNTNKNLKREFHEPAFYINKSNEPAYRYKTLLSTDVLKYSWQNFKASKAGIPQNFAYDRSNVKTLNIVLQKEKAAKINATLDKYRRDLYSHYEYTDVKGILTKLKQSNPHTKFIVFTTPAAEPLFELMKEQGLYPYYQRWLSDCADIFGELYNFMGPNTITANLDNYYDASHIYPQIGTLLAHKITGCPDTRIPADFGLKLKK
ncbi:MAG: hypothetical protein ABFD08_00770 [Syntrophomonas sp.]